MRVPWLDRRGALLRENFRIRTSRSLIKSTTINQSQTFLCTFLFR